MSWFDEAQKDALISPCNQYRYWLTRAWDLAAPRKKLMIIGLNPSTADASLDDPTIRRCMGFAKTWGFNELIMVNLFAFRSTDPAGLKSALDPIGPENNHYLLNLSNDAHLIIAAWGVHGELLNRNVAVTELLPNLQCLGTTKAGHPKHPLYLKADTLPIKFKAE